MSALTRRGFLAAAGGALAGAGLDRGSALAAAEPSRASKVTRETTLDVQWLETTLDGTRVKLRTYNGTVPGPLLTARPGDVFQIRVRNHLPPYDSAGWGGDMNVPHHLHTTNLHLHGLEIVPHLFEPVGTGDPAASMIAIRPGEERSYTLPLADDQPPGLYWYHPHHHGSTAVQAVSGMAGGVIVYGDVDEVPEIKAARDVVLVLQDIGLFPSETDPDLWLYEPRQNAIWNTFGNAVNRPGLNGPATDLQGGFSTGDYKLRYFLVNGQPYFKEVHDDQHQTEPVGTQLGVPSFHLRPGEVVRFRMLNGNSDNLMPIVVEGHEMHLIALDGINFPEPRTIPVRKVRGCYGEQQVLLAPANRAEFLIKASSTPGTYRIVQLHQNQQFLFSAYKVIAELVVGGEPKDMALPTRLPPPRRHYPLIRPDEIVAKRTAVFNERFPGTLNPLIGLDFMINDELYDETSVSPDWRVTLGTAEEWTLRVPDAGHGGNEGHPFHIHVNSFEVVSIGGVPVPAGTIQDTIWVNKASDVVIRMRFRQWTGKAVFHCHILPHEDTGMMKNFLIQKPG